MSSFDIPQILFVCFIIYTKSVYSSLGTSILPWADDKIIESGYPDFDDLFISRSRRNGGIRAPSPKQYELYLDLSKIEVLAEDPNDPSKSIECESSMLHIDSTEGIMTTYKPNDGIKCLEVRYENKVAWKHDPSVTTEFPKRVHFLLTGPIVFEMNENMFFFSVRSNGNFESVQMVNFDFSERDVSLITLNSTQNPVDIKPEGFKVKSCGFFLEYEFPSDTKCEGLRLKDQFPWLYDDSIYPEYPSSLYLFANQVLVVCAGRSFVKQFNLNNPGQAPMPREIMRLPLTGFKFEKKRGCLFYEIDSRVKCAGVNYDENEIWERDHTNPDAQYPLSVAFFLKGNTAIFDFDDSREIIRLENNEWRTIFSGKPEPIHLDIRKKSSTDMIDYDKTDKIHTYTAKDNRLFNTLIKSSWISSSVTTLWETDDYREYATKIVYDERDNIKVLDIYHVNGLKSVFKKSSKLFNSEPWEGPEVKCCETKLKPENIEILFEDDETPEYDDLPEPTTLATPVSESQPAEDGDPTPSPDSKTAHDTHIQEPISVEMQNETASVRNVQIKSTSPDLSPALGSVRAPYIEEADPQKILQDKTVAKHGRRVRSDLVGTIPVRKIPVHLDIRTRKTTKQFDYSESTDFLTYTANDDYYFRSVKNGETEVWRGGSIDGSALKVIAELDSSSYLVGLTLHLVNGDSKRFKYSNGRLDELNCKDRSNLPCSLDHHKDSSSQLSDHTKGSSVIDPLPTTISTHKDHTMDCPLSTNETIAIQP